MSRAQIEALDDAFNQLVPPMLTVSLISLLLLSLAAGWAVYESHLRQRQLLLTALRAPQRIRSARVETWGSFSTRCLRLDVEGEGERVVASEWAVPGALHLLNAAGVSVRGVAGATQVGLGLLQKT